MVQSRRRRRTFNPELKPRRLSVIADPRKPEAVQLGERMQAWLRERDAYADEPCDADLQIVLGGDGMVVRAARAHSEVPVLGIDFGQFGFLAHVPPSRWETRLKQVLAGHYDVRVDATIKVDLERDGKPLCSLWAVQDVVFHAFVMPGNGQQMAVLELYIDNKYLNPLPGDGLIVATSPGSSAYNLAAGGPVLAPGSQTFAITPICAHTPMRASFSVAESTPITIIQLGRFPISVCVDGQESFDEFAPNDVAHITADPRRFQLVTFGDTSFYSRFRQRFNYRIRPGYPESGLIKFHAHNDASTSSTQRTSPGTDPAGTIG
ncbi:MAG: NAD(+)/NADH kinase [Chloroflexi bacterium]|nr:NAD(+)/NADH kinase [Chloroflexota bacterium]